MCYQRLPEIPAPTIAQEDFEAPWRADIFVNPCELLKTPLRQVKSRNSVCADTGFDTVVKTELDLKQRESNKSDNKLQEKLIRTISLAKVIVFGGLSSKTKTLPRTLPRGGEWTRALFFQSW